MTLAQYIECDRLGCGERSPLRTGGTGLLSETPLGWGTLIEVITLDDNSILSGPHGDRRNVMNVCPACLSRSLM